jgi:hemoglobin/transferrin/lactoferrin receptor protein
MHAEIALHQPPASKRRHRAVARQPRQEKSAWLGAAMTFRKSSVLSSRMRWLAFGVSTAAFAASGVIAQAQEAYWLDGITVLATKTEERAIDALAAVSTIRSEQMNQLMVSRPADLFFGIPGVGTEITAQDPGTAISIRGLQDFGRVAVIIDGARQNFARLGHDGSGSFYLEPELLAEADVIRGPVANIYGSGAIGGVVSFRTKDVDDVLKPGEKWGVATHGEIGSNKFNYLGSIFGGFRAGPNAEFFAGGTYRHQDDYKDGAGNVVPNSGETVSTGIAKATFRPADGHQVKFGGIYYDADWTNGTPGVSSAIRDSNSKNTTVTGSWKYSKPEDKLFDFDASAYWNRVDVGTLTTWVLPGMEPYFGAVGNQAGYKIDTKGFDVHNTSRAEFGQFRHALTYGGDFFQDNVSNTDPGGFGVGYNPNGERSVGGAFAQLKTNYSTWFEIITALRYDTFKLDGTDVDTGQAVNNKGDRLSPKVTVGITPLPWFTVYGTYAEGYRAPAITETLVSAIHPGALGSGAAFPFLPNPDLKPEIGKSKEIGINIKRDDIFKQGDRFRFKANVFRNDVDDFIDTAFIDISADPGAICPYVPVNPNPPVFDFSPAWFFCAQYQNVSKARIEGVEFEGTYDRGDWFVGLSGHKMKGRDLIEGDPLAKVPPPMIATTVGARFFDQKFTVALRWAAVAAKKLSDLPIDTDPSIATGSYNLVNLYFGYQPNENVIAALSIENLLNENYRVYTHELNSPGITVKGSLRIRFADVVPTIKEDRRIVK